jgi:putative MATE family efflux protein
MALIQQKPKKETNYNATKLTHTILETDNTEIQRQYQPGVIPTDDGHSTDLVDSQVTQTTFDGRQAEPLNERNLRRRVLNMAAPVIGENFLEVLLGVVDTLLVAQLGADALAGVGSAQQVLFFVISALSALSIGSTVLVARAFGAGKLPRAGRLARQSLLWSGLLAVPLAIGGVFLAKPIIGLYGIEPAATQIGIEYLQVIMGTAVVLTGLLIGGGILRGAGDSRTPMIVTAIANVVNVGLSYALIYGRFGLPALGAVGSAWASFMARGLALTLLIWVLWRGRNGVAIRGLGRWWPNLNIAKQVLSIGIPAAIEGLHISAAFVVLVMVVAGLGTVTLAAHQVAMNALALSFLPGIGFGIAATALVGQSIGARRPAEGAAVTRIATMWGILWMSAMGVLILFFAPQIMRFFTREPQMVAIGAAGLRVVALAQPFWAVLFVQAGALRGLGNTKFPLRVNATGIWLAVLLAYLLIQFIGGELNTVWGAFLIVSPGMAAFLWWRFRRAIAEAM